MNKPTQQDAKAFLRDVLKLGSKQNLFDLYMRKNKIHPDYLADLIAMVGDELKKY